MLKFSEELKAELTATTSKEDYTTTFKQAFQNGTGTVWCAVSFPPPVVKFRSPQKHHPLKKR